MAKRTADPCIFCEALPCVCEGTAKPKRTGKRLPSVVPGNTVTVELPEEPESSKSGTSKLARMKARALEDATKTPAPVAVAPQSSPPRPRARRPYEEPEKFDSSKVKARIASTLDEDTVVLNGAIRALGDLLSDEDRKTYAELLSTEPSLEELKILWKARHRGYQAASP